MISPVGPRDWDPDVAIAVVRELDAEIRESLARLKLIAGNPIDRTVARALSARDVELGG